MQMAYSEMNPSPSNSSRATLFASLLALSILLIALALLTRRLLLLQRRHAKSGYRYKLVRILFGSPVARRLCCVEDALAAEDTILLQNVQMSFANQGSDQSSGIRPLRRKRILILKQVLLFHFCYFYFLNSLTKVPNMQKFYLTLKLYKTLKLLRTHKKK